MPVLQISQAKSAWLSTVSSLLSPLHGAALFSAAHLGPDLVTPTDCPRANARMHRRLGRIPCVNDEAEALRDSWRSCFGADEPYTFPGQSLALSRAMHEELMIGG